MIPRSTLVVSRFTILVSSEGRRLPRPCVSGLILAHGVVQQLPPFGRNAGGPLNRPPETAELLCEVFERRLELTPQGPPVFREQEITCHATNHCADGGRDYRS